MEEVRRKPPSPIRGPGTQSHFSQLKPGAPAGVVIEIYLALSFITLMLAFTSFFTNVACTRLSIGKLTMAFVVA